MFLVTGGLYTWGFKGSYHTEAYDISLDQPLSKNVTTLTERVSMELESRSLSLPTGAAKVKKGGTSWKLEWAGSNRDVVLEPTDDPLIARMSIKETTWYRNLVQLHKAKGGQLFKVYAAALAIGLFVILTSGFIMAWQVPKFRRLAGVCAAAGALLFAVVVSLS